MRPDILIKIRTNPNLNTFLKYNSYWYKELIRNPNSFPAMVGEMKKEFKLTTTDKINKLTDKMNMIRTFLEVMR